MQKFKYLFLLLLVLNFSCVKNETNSDFKELNDITITGLNKVYQIGLGDYLVIEPTITTRFGDDSKLDYVWYKYNTTSINSRDTLSKEKNLNVQINNVLPGMQHFVVLKVTDRENKTFSTAITELYTSGTYSKGTMFLVKNDNQLDLAFIKNDSETVMNDIYSKANDGEKLSNESKQVMCLNPIPSSDIGMYKQVIVTADNQNGGVTLDPEVISKKGYFVDMFTTRPKGDILNIQNHTVSQSCEYFIINGKIYDRSISRYDETEAKFLGERISTAEPTNYHLSPIVLNPRTVFGAALVFANNGGKMMIASSGANGFTFYRDKTGTSFSKFDPNNLPGMSLIGGGLQTDYHNLWFLMKKDDGSIKLLTLMDSYINWVGKVETTGNIDIPREQAPMLYRADKIISTSYTEIGTYPYVDYLRGITGLAVYVVDNKVYAFNTVTQAEFLLIDGDKEGFTIDNLLPHTITEINSENETVTYTRLGLAIRDSKTSGKKGGVAYYKINFAGGMSAQMYYKKVGFCDQVISFDYKSV